MIMVDVQVKVRLDVDEELHRQFIAWHGENPDAVADVVLLGFHVLKHGLLETYCHGQADRRLADAEARHAREAGKSGAAVDALTERLREARCDVDEAVRARVGEVTGVYRDQIATLNQLLAVREGAIANIASQHVEQLRAQLAQRDAEIATLRGSNHVKGASGERMLMRFVEDRFASWEVTNKGRTGHEADIHMTNDKGDLIIFESKNKERVTGLDVEKFYRDIEELAGTRKLVGAVFVSLKTKNIPGKGTLALERRGNVVVLFAGFEDEEEMDRLFGGYMSLLVDAANVVAEDPTAERVEDIVAKLAGPFATVKKNKVRIDKLKNECLVQMSKLILELEQDNAEILKCLEKLVKPGGGKRRKAPCKAKSTDTESDLEP
jgi:hypothetical protein